MDIIVEVKAKRWNLSVIVRYMRQCWEATIVIWAIRRRREVTESSPWLLKRLAIVFRF